MGEKQKNSQEKLITALTHLGVCTSCRCKTAGDLQVIEQDLREIANALQNSRAVENEMLTECRKKLENSSQECQDNFPKPCVKKNRIYIRWNKK